MSAEDGPVIIGNLGHCKRLLGVFQKLHVGAPSLLEAKVDGHVGPQRQQVLQGLQKQGEGGLEVDAVGSQDDGRFELDNLCWEFLAPVGRGRELARKRRMPTRE